MNSRHPLHRMMRAIISIVLTLAGGWGLFMFTYHLPYLATDYFFPDEVPYPMALPIYGALHVLGHDEFANPDDMDTITEIVYSCLSLITAGFLVFIANRTADALWLKRGQIPPAATKNPWNWLGDALLTAAASLALLYGFFLLPLAYLPYPTTIILKDILLLEGYKTVFDPGEPGRFANAAAAGVPALFLYLGLALAAGGLAVFLGKRAATRLWPPKSQN